ncbi:hypothetical protein [Persephonella hydrogeniphila]|uniref:hypothetical protein n=1 Tax=Persephonella hydrogeniphila TaxID=198703 RepID=UPI001C5DFD0A|nr:hypothetical protein [Persephonella hydrogeniphila]
MISLVTAIYITPYIDKNIENVRNIMLAVINDLRFLIGRPNSILTSMYITYY